jgi:hypothetical protein
MLQQFDFWSRLLCQTASILASIFQKTTEQQGVVTPPLNCRPSVEISELFDTDTLFFNLSAQNLAA